MFYFERRLIKLLNEGKFENYFLALKNSNKLKTLVVKNFLLLNQNKDDFLYQNKIEEEIFYSLFEGKIIPNESTIRCLKCLNISDEDIENYTVKSYNRAKNMFDKHKKELNLPLDLEFPLTIEDFKFSPVNLGISNSRKLSLDTNYKLIKSIVEKFHEESANYYVKTDKSMHENESLFWKSLRQRLRLSYTDIEHMSAGKFSVEQLSALENDSKPKSIEITLDREAYFKFLKENLIKLDNMYEHLTVDFCEYKFYVEKLFIPLIDVEQFGEPFKYFFKPFNVGNKKYITTHCSFFIR